MSCEEKEIINYKSGLSRFCGKKELYEKYIRFFVDKDDFQRLSDAIKSCNYSEAFNIAHNLKSATGNLSFERLFEECSSITEFLRDEKNVEMAVTMFPKLKSEHEALIAELENGIFIKQ